MKGHGIMANMDRIIGTAASILASTVRDGGGSFAPDGTAADRPGGFFVGMGTPGDGGAFTYPLDAVGTGAGIADAAALIMWAFGAQDPDLYVGTWVDHGMVHLEHSRWYADRVEAESIGRARGEIAIWDVARGREIVLGR